MDLMAFLFQKLVMYCGQSITTEIYGRAIGETYQLTRAVQKWSALFIEQAAIGMASLQETTNMKRVWVNKIRN